MPIYKSHSDGRFKRKDFAKIGKNVIFERGVMVFHPENIEIGDNVYIGHNTILKGYYKNKLIIGNEVFISPGCQIYGSAGVEIKSQNGIGPGVIMLGTPHDLNQDNLGPINFLPMTFNPIVIEEGCDIGMGSKILGGVTIGRGTQVGAGAVVTRSTKPFSVVVGVPAKMLRMRRLCEGQKEYDWTKKIANQKKSIEKVVFIGSKKLGLECLKTMYALRPKILTDLITLDDSKDGRSILADFKKFAKEKKINFHLAKNRKSFELIIRKIKPDLGIVVGWYWLLSKNILDFIPDGVFGIHASNLPKYRGGAPLVWAMINGDKETGISFFKFDEGVDSGDLVGQKKIKIGPNEAIANIINKVEINSVKLLKEKYLALVDRKIKFKPQSKKGATYFGQRNHESGLIIWDNTAQEVYNFIRAQSKPYPGAFTFVGGKKIIVWQVKLLSSVYEGLSGQVFSSNKEGVIVICGDNRALLLKKVQQEGEKEKEASEVIKSVFVKLENRK